MKKANKFTSMALLATAMLASMTSRVSAAGAVGPIQEGAVEVESTTYSTTVMGINYVNRTLTVGSPNGRLATFKVSKEVTNFNQINSGDKIKVTALESLAVFLRKTSDPASAGEADTVTLAPKGALPGVVVTDAKEVTAKITLVNRRNRQATLQFVDGTTKTIRVNKSVDLSAVKPGDDVTVRLTEALAILVEKA